MIRYIALIILVASIWINVGCSKSGNNPITPLKMDDSSDLPVSMSLIGSDSISAIGILGAFELALSDDYSDAELIPLRHEMIGESTIVNGGAYFTQFPCVDCLQIKSIGLDENVIIEFSIRHPYDRGNPNKPPSLTNRLDLDIFDVALVFQPNNRTPVDFNALDVSAYAGMLLNADGYTKDISSIIDDDVLAPYKMCYTYRRENNRFPMGDSVRDFDVILNKGTNSFNLYLTFSYGISADAETRLEPTYFVPEFNRKSAWEIEVFPPNVLFGQTWVEGDTTTEHKILFYIYDWNHNIEVSDCYPDFENTDRISAPSDIESVLVEIPGMIDSTITASLNGPQYEYTGYPWIYTASIANENNLHVGSYYGLVKALDSRIPGEGFSPDKIIDSPDGVRYEFYPIDEFATYQIFDVQVARNSYNINPQVVGGITGLGHSNLIEIKGNLAFVGDFTSFGDRGCGIRIFDISNFHEPEFIAHLKYKTVHDIELSGNILFVTGLKELHANFTLYDISDPHEPVIMADIASMNELFATIAVDGDYAYVQRLSGVEIYDISDPYNPFLVTLFCGYMGPALFPILVEDDYAFICGDDLLIYDVSMPNEPIELSCTDIDYFNWISFAKKDDYLYVTQEHYIQVMDIADPYNPVQTASLFTNHVKTTDCVINGNYLYVTGQIEHYIPGRDLSIVNIQDPLNPFVERYSERMGGFKVAIDDDYMVTASGDHGMDIIDISDPVNCFVESNLPTFQPSSVVLKDNYAIITGNVYLYSEKRVDLIDISDPQYPTIQGPFLDNNVTIREVHENLLFCTIDDLEHIMDISDPQNPVDLCSFELQFTSFNKALFHDDYIYVSVYKNGGFLYVIDISDPSNPVIVNQIPDGSSGPDEMYVCNGSIIAFYRYSNNGAIKVFDISEPETPVRINNHFLDYCICASAVTSELAYVVKKEPDRIRFEFQIWDISDPLNLWIRSSAYLGSCYDDFDLTVSESFAYLAYQPHLQYQGLISVYDISNPDNPVIVDSVECYVEDMIKRDNFIYSVHPNHGFSIVKLWD